MAGEEPLLNDWRQGDLALAPITLPIISTDEGDGSECLIFTAPVGVAVISQSCDIVRCHEQKPYVQVAALTPANEAELAQAKAGANVRYGFLSALAPKGLVVDFDIAATVDKETVRRWTRDDGCANDNERRVFSASLARHRERYAFPDEFSLVIRPIRKWIEKKRSANSSNGDFVRAIKEVRVECADWDEPAALILFFLLDEDHTPDQRAEWDEIAIVMAEKAATEKYKDVAIRVLTLDDLSAREYLATIRVDLDGLSDA